MTLPQERNGQTVEYEIEAGGADDQRPVPPREGNSGASIEPSEEALRTPDLIRSGQNQYWPDRENSEECFARNISETLAVGIEFEEDPPRQHDPAVAGFDQELAEAQQLEEQIEALETETDQRREPLVREQLLRAFRAWSRVEVGQVPIDHVDDVIADAGIKRHGNERIPCSALMRAIVGENEAKGTPRYKQKRVRASTYASAVDYAIHKRMTEEELRTELHHPPTPGEHHGIEALAERGRALRREEKTEDSSSEPPAEMPYGLTGDLSGVEPGYHLMLVNIEGETAKAAFLHVSAKLLDRALAEHNKTRSEAQQR
jgi:hypothetical protein